jgi:hypothetical protein
MTFLTLRQLEEDTTMRIASVILAAGLLTMSMPARAESYQWVQYTHAGLEARVTMSDSACPSIRIDGATSAMSVHAAPAPDYPVTTCKNVLPLGAKAATIADVPLALPKADPQRIVVIGDTGCRIKGKKAQACNDPVQWPFRLVAEMAAHQKPDLIVHVGDYHYRETTCPEGFVGCEGTPFGDCLAGKRFARRLADDRNYASAMCSSRAACQTSRAASAFMAAMPRPTMTSSKA